MKVLGCNALQARLSYVCKQMLNVVNSAAADVRPDVHQSSGCTGFFSSVEFGTYRLSYAHRVLCVQVHGAARMAFVPSVISLVLSAFAPTFRAAHC